MDREILFCLQALRLGLVDPAALKEAGQRWEQGGAPLKQALIEAARLGADDVALLERTVERAVAAKDGDVHAAAESLGGSRALTESFREVLQVENTLPRSEVEATLARSAPAPGLDAERLAEVTPEAPGRYDVRGEMGRGGIGRVLVAFDAHAGREVAIKELLEPGEGTGTPGSGSQVGSARFLREARLTAQLEHPAIVPVYEVGRRPDGTLYYTMKLVRGRTLAQALHESRGVDGRLEHLPHFAEMCAAVAFAHSRGVLHRDLKPHNVMIGEFHETILLDWGLAKVRGTEREDRRFARQMEALRDVAAGKTVAGAALGTPEYMPPEQAFGDVDRIDEPADVYSLGAVLYELLTGRPPFTGAHAYEVLSRVQRYGEGKEHLVPVRTLEPAAPAELAAVAEKALFPQAHGRYRTAKDLLDDVHAFMSGRRVGAYQYSSLELVRRFVAQNRALSALAAGLVLTLVVGSGVLLSAWRAAEAGKAQAQAAEVQVHRHLAAAYQEKAAQLAQERDWLGARVFAAAALRETPYNPRSRYPDPATFDTEEASAATASLQSTLWAAHHQGLVRHARSLAGHTAAVELARFSPQGKWLATGGSDRQVRVFDVATGALVHARATGGTVIALAFRPDGKQLAFGGSEKRVQLWAPGSAGEPSALNGHEGAVTSLAYSPDGRLLASAGRDRTVRLWDVASRREVGRLPVLAETAGIDRLAWSPDGKRLAGVGADRPVVLWDAAGKRIAAALEGHDGGGSAVVFSADGSRLYTLGNDRAVRSWDLDTGDEFLALSLSEGQPRGLAVREGGGRTLLVVGRDEVVELWDADKQERVGVLRGHGATVRSVSLSADGGTLATTSLDRRVRLWTLSSGTPMVRLGGHEGAITGLATDGKRALTAGRDRSLQLWDLGQRALLRAWTAHDADLTAVALLPGGDLASAARDGTIKRWHGESGQVLAGPEPAARVGSLVARGDWLAAGDATGRVRLFRSSGVTTLAAHTEAVSALAATADGATLASSGRDKTLRLWNPGDGTPRASFTLPERVRAMAFSPDGALLAVADQAWAISLLDPVTGEARRVLSGHHDAPRTLGFSADGRLLVSAGASDTTTRIWEVATGRLVQVIDLVGEARVAAFVEGGLLTSDGDGLVLAPLTLDLWMQAPDGLLSQAQADAAMDLVGFELRPR